MNLLTGDSLLALAKSIYYYHDHKYVEHDSPDEGSPEDIGLLFTVTDVSMRLSSSESK